MKIKIKNSADIEVKIQIEQLYQLSSAKIVHTGSRIKLA